MNPALLLSQNIDSDKGKKTRKSAIHMWKQISTKLQNFGTIKYPKLNRYMKVVSWIGIHIKKVAENEVHI